MPDIPTEPDARTVLTNRRETITIETRGRTRRVETGTDVFTHTVPDDQDPAPGPRRQVTASYAVTCAPSAPTTPR